MDERISAGYKTSTRREHRLQRLIRALHVYARSTQTMRRAHIRMRVRRDLRTLDLDVSRLALDPSMNAIHLRRLLLAINIALESQRRYNARLYSARRRGQASLCDNFCSESFSALSHQVDIRLLSGWDVDQATLLLIAGQPARRVRFGARLSSARLWRFLAVIRWEKIERFDSGSRLGKSSM